MVEIENTEITEKGSGNVNLAQRFKAGFKQKWIGLRSSMINQQVNLCGLANESEKRKRNIYYDVILLYYK